MVGDFVLAKLLDHRARDHCRAWDSLSLENLSTGHSLEKTDMFGFEIMLPELITGQRALDFGRLTTQKGAMLDWVVQLEDRKLRQLADKLLRDDFREVELEQGENGILEAQYPFERPRMSEVLKLLEYVGSSENKEVFRTVDSPRLVPHDCPGLRYMEVVEEYSLIEVMELSCPR